MLVHQTLSLNTQKLRHYKQKSEAPFKMMVYVIFYEMHRLTWKFMLAQHPESDSPC